MNITKYFHLRKEDGLTKYNYVHSDMTQEDKQLLLKDLCARSPYGVIINYYNVYEKSSVDAKVIGYANGFIYINNHSLNPEFVKPYLRPMSSMTEDEVKEIQKINWQFCKPKNGDCYVGDVDDGYCSVSQMANILGYLNAHHFDYRGLIEKGLALEASEGMYKVE